MSEAPICWICLSESPDASGKPLVRDCSCRGTSGWAHVSCIIDWASNNERNKTGSTGTATTAVDDGFMVCPNCKQMYQKGLRSELSKAQVAFVEREYGLDGDDNSSNVVAITMRANALNMRMTMIDCDKEQDVIEGEELCSKILQLIEHAKTTTDDNNNNSSQKSLVRRLEAPGYMAIGSFHMRLGFRFGFTEWRECLQKAKEYFELATEIYRKDGDSISLMASERMVEIVNSRLIGNNNVLERAPADQVQMKRKTYQFYLEKLGQEHTQTIDSGVQLAQALFESYMTIESERLLSRLHEVSLRVHGVEHDSTICVEQTLQRVKERRVCVIQRQADGNDDDIFQALRYYDGGDDDDDDNDKKSRIIIQGPIQKPRNVATEQTFDEDCINNVSYVKGTPVVCHGLQKGVHLNNKIGEIRDFDAKSDRYTIHFEDKSLKPAKIKGNNLRIVFDLPDA
jgi:hypothetical protein